jgi:3'-phosphoadenosine 5'-phosphosulfate sulfotransferase (PAPS reductase)/FAD synthetase
MSEYVLSLSYGKDSLACLGAIEELGLPLDRIVHAEVWATDTIPADLPPMVEFKKKADEIILQRWGIKVEHVFATKDGEKLTYEKHFYKIQKRKPGGRLSETSVNGFPYQRGAWCNSRLKVSALNKAAKGKTSCCVTRYIGIAADEPSRFHNLTERKRSPLVEAGWDEAKCRKWCEDNDLLSPIYSTATRGGCWFCHNQSVDQLRLLRRNYPEYWALMLKWDLDSPVSFKPDGKTLHDFDKRFQMEDEGFIKPGERFLWESLDSELVNYRLF